MKSYNLILAAVGFLLLTACNSTHPQRTASSVVSLNNIENFNSSMNYVDNQDVFKYQAGQFIMIANDPALSNIQKQHQLNNILLSASKSLNEQCDWIDELWSGCGLIKEQSDAVIAHLKNDVQKNNFKSASQKASQIYHTYFRQ